VSPGVEGVVEMEVFSRKSRKGDGGRNERARRWISNAEDEGDRRVLLDVQQEERDPVWMASHWHPGPRDGVGRGP
jgi:hypothetical protein